MRIGLVEMHNAALVKHAQFFDRHTVAKVCGGEVDETDDDKRVVDNDQKKLVLKESVHPEVVDDMNDE